MGLLDFLFGKKEEEQVEEGEDLDELLAQTSVVTPTADHYVLKIDVRNEGDVDEVIKELEQENIVIVNISLIAKQEKRLTNMINRLKEFVAKNNGDIGKLSDVLIIVTPKNIKLVKRKKK